MREAAGPVLIAIGGLSGTGKSTLAAALAPLIGGPPGALHLRSDVERKVMLGVGETDRLPAAAYAPEMTARVYAILAEKARAALASGRSVVVDAVFSKDDERVAIETAATVAGGAFTGLWLEAPPGVMATRVAARTGDASDATVAVLAAQIARGGGNVTWTKLDAGHQPATVLATAKTVLGVTCSGV